MWFVPLKSVSFLWDSLPGLEATSHSVSTHTHDLPVYSSLVLRPPHSPCSSLNASRTLTPQDLCTCSSFCLKHYSSRHLHDLLFHFIWVSLPWTSYIKLHNFPTMILQFSNTHWVSYNSIPFWHYQELAQTSQVKGSVPWNCSQFRY